MCRILPKRFETVDNKKQFVAMPPDTRKELPHIMFHLLSKMNLFWEELNPARHVVTVSIL